MRFNSHLLAANVLLGFTTLDANAALTAYTAVGDQDVVYSSVSDITWTADANLLGTLQASDTNLINTIISTITSIADTPNFLDTPAYSGSHTLTTADFGTDGQVNWFGAQAFVSYLNAINYAGSNKWALPAAGDNPQTGYNPTGSQFGQLFYNELNGTAGGAIPDTTNFRNEQVYAYWLATEYASEPSNAWDFVTDGGSQGFGNKNFQFYAWAVSPGQVSAVPVPGAVWLFGTGVIGYLALKRRRYLG